MLNLTPDEIQNLVAFGNRAQMAGAEADTWVSLKAKLIAEARALVSEKDGKGAPLKSVKE